MTTFKPYRYKGCIIYSPKNRQFLEGFAVWYIVYWDRTKIWVSNILIKVKGRT
jgi:hypothetical protein